MIEYRKTKNGHEWVGATHKFQFVDSNYEGEKFTADLDYWKTFEARWENFRITDIKEVEWSDGQLGRLKEIKGMPEGFSEVYESYIADGTIDTADMPDNHPFVLFARKKELDRLRTENEVLNGAVVELMTLVMSR